MGHQSDHDHGVCRQLGLLNSCDVCAAANLDSNIATACCICAKVALLVGRLFLIFFWLWLADLRCVWVLLSSPWQSTLFAQSDSFFFFFFFLGYRGIVHPPSADEGTERTWFEPEQRPRKRVPKRSVHGKQSPQGASKMSWRQDDQP